LWRETARNMAIQREWLVALGRQNAHARLAHFICEVSARFQAAGLGNGRSCPLPMTQADISDALGISVVHVNRVLQLLRKEGLVALSQGTLRIIDRAALIEAAEFDPAYLGLNAEVQ
jgi:CRP-like cAMP-binding protein